MDVMVLNGIWRTDGQWTANLSRSLGLETLLNGTSSLEEALHRIIYF